MLATATVLVDIGRSLREGFFMFWETLWPLVLGFGLAGAVQIKLQRNIGLAGRAREFGGPAHFLALRVGDRRRHLGAAGLP